jgi:hypothetical protein
MKRIFSMTLEGWNTFLQFASAVLLGLTFAVGAGAIWTGYVLGKRQEVRIAATERGTAEANKKVAEAGEGTAKALAEVAAANERTQQLENSNLALRGQVATLETQAAEAKIRQADAEKQLAGVKKEQQPRALAMPDFALEMKKSRPGNLVLMYQEGSMETQLFALNIWNQLSMAGWQVEKPKGVSGLPTDKGLAMAELIFVLRSIDEEPSSIKALREALSKFGYRKVSLIRDDTLPDDVPRFWVGPKITWGGLQPP